LPPMALQRQLKRFPAVLLPARLMELLPASGFRIRSGKLPVRTRATEIVNVYERSGFKIRRLLLLWPVVVGGLLALGETVEPIRRLVEIGLKGKK